MNITLTPIKPKSTSKWIDKKKMVIMVKLAASGVAHDTPRKRQKSVNVANRRLEKTA
jgi:hypothetical protein